MMENQTSKESRQIVLVVDDGPENLAVIGELLRPNYSIQVANNGAILANYTNGKSQTVGFVALANFANMQGLKAVGGNAWVETSASGQPVVGQPGTNGLAMLKGQAVEASNVDMSQELVNMIIAQRTYQANAQSIKTQDQLLQTLITLR